MLAQGVELGCIGGPELEPSTLVYLGDRGGGGRHRTSPNHVSHVHAGAAATLALAAHVVPHHASLPGVHPVHLRHVLDAGAKVADVTRLRRERQRYAFLCIGHRNVRSFHDHGAAGAELLHHVTAGGRHG